MSEPVRMMTPIKSIRFHLGVRSSLAEYDDPEYGRSRIVRIENKIPDESLVGGVD